MNFAEWFAAHKRVLGALGIWVLCLAVFVGFTGNRLSSYDKKEAAVKAAEAVALRAQIAVQAQVIAQQDKAISDQEAINEVLSKKYAAALAHLPTAPPKPVHAPTEASQVALDLASYGLCAPTVGQVATTSLTGVDGQHVWEWRQEWARMPAMEAALSGTQVALQDCDQLQKGLKTQVGNYAVQVANLDEKYTLLTKATEAEKSSLTYTIKSLKADKLGLTVKIVVLVPTVAYIGYRLGRR